MVVSPAILGRSTARTERMDLIPRRAANRKPDSRRRWLRRADDPSRPLEPRQGELDHFRAAPGTVVGGDEMAADP